jgi:heptosyltransferase III
MLRRNILIFHLGALGDFVLTWPFAVALGRVYPQSRIIFVTHAQKGALAEKVLRLDSTDVEGGWHSLFAESAALPERPAALLAGAQAIYSFLSPSSVWISNVATLSADAKVVALEPQPPESFGGHATQWIVEQLKDHPIERSATEQILRSVADRGIGFNRTAGRNVVIHPGSGSPGKCWPFDRFVEVAKRLRSLGADVRVIVGEVEAERWSAREFDSLAKVADLRRPRTYLELLTELSTAGLFVGNDSGPGHLAAIIGTPTVSIFGPTDPNRWKPCGPKVQVVQGETLDAVSVDDVWTAMERYNHPT